jgi:hypothetical protein
MWLFIGRNIRALSANYLAFWGFWQTLAFSVCLSGVVVRLFWQSLWLARQSGCF